MLKRAAKSLLARTPYRVVRDRGANRFQAIEVTLLNMRDRGFWPTVIIDGGAHLGDFALTAARLFPDARLHLVEPQPACLPPLRTLCAAKGFVLHEVALSDARCRVPFVYDPSTPGTGAYVTSKADAPTVPAETLDALFAGTMQADDRVLLKLDLQGHELAALRGARAFLPAVEAILTEVNLYGPPWRLAEMFSLLDEAGFELHDVASLAGRRRDNRLHYGDFVFVKRSSPLAADRHWD